MGSVVSGVLGGRAAKKAANAQTDAANQANETQRYIFDMQRADQEPWRKTGQQFLQTLAGMNGPNGFLQKRFSMEDFQADPAYQFRMDQGNKAIERSAAARGGLFGGATARALQGFSQGLASEEYGNAYNRFNNDQTNQYNRLANLAGYGQTANAMNANSAQNYGNNVSNNQLMAGNARAAGYVGRANAWNPFLQQVDSGIKSAIMGGGLFGGG